MQQNPKAKRKLLKQSFLRQSSILQNYSTSQPARKQHSRVIKILKLPSALYLQYGLSHNSSTFNFKALPTQTNFSCDTTEEVEDHLISNSQNLLKGRTPAPSSLCQKGKFPALLERTESPIKPSTSSRFIERNKAYLYNPSNLQYEKKNSNDQFQRSAPSSEPTHENRWNALNASSSSSDDDQSSKSPK
jgi:hypothetical protein